MKMLFAAVSAVTLLAAAPAFAQVAPGWYVNVGYTGISSDGEEGDLDLSALNGRLGYRFTPNVSVEGEALIGIDDQDFNDAGAQVNVSFNGAASIFAVGSFPVGPNLDVFGRAGLGYGSMEVQVRGPGKNDAFGSQESDALWGVGVGAQWFWDGRNGLRGEYTRYEFMGDEDDGLSGSLDTWSVSYVHRFGG